MGLARLRHERDVAALDEHVDLRPEDLRRLDGPPRDDHRLRRREPTRTSAAAEMVRESYCHGNVKVLMYSHLADGGQVTMNF